MSPAQKSRHQAWTPSSWQERTCQQAIVYPDPDALQAALDALQNSPGLIAEHDIIELQLSLSAATYGERFVLQAGDCAETLGALSHAKNNMQLLHALSLQLEASLDRSVVTVGRVAGQFCKPRSLLYETQSHKQLPNYRGDLVNDRHFEVQARSPNPSRLQQGYTYAQDCLSMLQTLESKQQKPIYTSHEALHLGYEQSLTRHIQHRWYNLSTHYPWLGMRTGDLNGAHVEYLRGIANPIAVKVGPNMTIDWIQRLVHILNPQKMPGRLTLIHRFGCSQIQNQLPKLIQAVLATQVPVLWSCDPMHGNTRHVPGTNYKTRYVDDILEEWFCALAIHTHHQTRLSGIHLELTQADVTECVGGYRNPIRLNELPNNYQSHVDPRLNAQQATEVIAEVARSFKL